MLLYVFLLALIALFAGCAAFNLRLVSTGWRHRDVQRGGTGPIEPDMRNTVTILSTRIDLIWTDGREEIEGKTYHA